MRESKMEVDIARIELERVENSIRNAETQASNKLEGLDLEIGMLEKDCQEISRRINQAKTITKIAKTNLHQHWFQSFITASFKLFKILAII